MSFNFMDRPAKARQVTEGETPTYEVGRYTVTVHPDGSLTYSANSYRSHDPRKTFPNMEIVDGKLEIPIEDMVDFVLARIEPAELAEDLWSHEEVRAAFIETFTAHYRGVFTPAERRAFMAEVKEAVHSVRLDVLANSMSRMEHALSTRFHYWQQIDNANRVLRDFDVNMPNGQPLRLQNLEQGEDLKVGGTLWHEARDWWRAEMLKQFPIPNGEEEKEIDQ
jgi:hypothetical protein